MSGKYLGEELSEAARKVRLATIRIATGKPDWIEDIDAPLSDEDKERLRVEVKDSTKERVELFDELIRLRDQAMIEALS